MPEQSWTSPFKSEQKKAEPKSEPKAQVKQEKKEVKTIASMSKEECLAAAKVILDEHCGIESDVPVGSDYWKLLNRYRGLDKA